MGSGRLLLVLLLLLASTLAQRPLARTVEKYCTRVEDCDGIWVDGTAYRCSDEKCECHPDATLKDRACVCNPGFVRDQRNCIKIGLNESCTSDTACSGTEHAVCTNGVCRCEAETVAVSVVCLPVAKEVGDGCDDGKQCSYHLGPNVDCVNKQCACKSGHRPGRVDGQQKCLPEAGLTQLCEDSAQCVKTDFTTCQDGTCQCKQGYTDISNIKCLPEKRFGESCENHAQCYKFSGPWAGCRDLKCVCEDGSYHNGTWCLKKHGLKESCRGDNEGCYQEKGGNMYIECVNDMCVCKSGHKESADNSYCEPGAAGHASISTLFLLAVVLATSSGLV